MKRGNTEDIVYQLAQPVAEEMNLELVDVEFVKEGAHWYLRVFLDKPGGLEIDDCQAMSHRLSDILDEKDPITQAYFLEISSPGLERPLKRDEDFEKFAGELANVTTFAPFEGQKSFTGHLVGLRDNSIVLNIKDKEVAIPRDKVAAARLAVEF